MESRNIGMNGRFAILTHDHPFFHWDLLLEVGDVAWTWRIVSREAGDGRREQDGQQLSLPHPSTLNSQQISANRIGDHRLHYLTYQGPVSGNRGQVARIDEGTYRVLGESESGIEVEFAGRTGPFTWHLPLA